MAGFDVEEVKADECFDELALAAAAFSVCAKVPAPTTRFGEATVTTSMIPVRRPGCSGATLAMGLVSIGHESRKCSGACSRPEGEFDHDFRG